VPDPKQESKPAPRPLRADRHARAVRPLRDAGGAPVLQAHPYISVTMSPPGQITLARIPLEPYSTAAALVKAITPALAAE
jgi:hypothetical protein